MRFTRASARDIAAKRNALNAVPSAAARNNNYMLYERQAKPPKNVYADVHADTLKAFAH